MDFLLSNLCELSHMAFQGSCNDGSQRIEHIREADYAIQLISSRNIHPELFNRIAHLVYSPLAIEVISSRETTLMRSRPAASPMARS